MSELLQLSGTTNTGIPFTRKTNGEVLEFYLSGEVLPPEEYVEWFDAIRNSRASDTIKIYLNTCGGDLHTALQFLRVLSEAEAEVTCSIEGACMSAGTIIFLAGDVLEITPHSMILIHSYSGGSFGKGPDMHSQMAFEKVWSEKLFHDIYEGFLSTAEINKVLKGEDLWLDTDEVVLRCQVAMEEKQKAYEIEQSKE